MGKRYTITAVSLAHLQIEITACRQCPRLVAWRESVARTKRRAYRDWEYWGRPVPGFGDARARILVVGLAPGAHGSNRTGRMFTGDASGNFLYPALYRAGLANQPHSTARDDGLSLRDVYITAVVRCAPPANKPTSDELDHCRPYLEREIQLLKPKVIVCLGRIAFEGVLRIFSTASRKEVPFRHGAAYKLNGASLEIDPWVLCSYHPSQQNTLTGRLTAEMFDAIWARAKELLYDA